MDKMVDLILDVKNLKSDVEVRFVIPECGRVRISFRDPKWNETWTRKAWDIPEIGRVLAEEGVRISKEDARTLKCAI